MKRFLFATAFLFNIIFINFTLTIAYSPPVQNGITYLNTTQSPEGTWGASGVSNHLLASTAETALSLKFLGETTNTHYTAAVEWLNNQSIDTTSEIALRMIVAAPGSVADRDLLLSYFDPYGSAWGGHKYFGNNALDTALAVKALKGLNSSDPYINDVMGRGATYLKNCQNSDGGWGFTEEDDSDVTLTAMVMDVLAGQKSSMFQVSMTLGVQFLLAHQHADGGFGTGAESTVYDSALCFVALQESGADYLSAVSSVQGYLANAQQSDGSWNHDAYETALAIRVLYRIQPNLSGSESDIVFSPAMPLSGQSTTITATIHNSGCEGTQDIRVRFFHGDPLNGGTQIGTDQLIASLGAGQQSDVSITHSFTGNGEQTIFVQIDPLNTIQEYNENDNLFSKRLWIATGPDLTAGSGDLVPSTHNPAPGEIFILSYDVRNVGESQAGPFNCTIYDGNPASGGILLGTNALSGVTGAGKRGGTLGVTLYDLGRHTLYLVIDPENQVAEMSETNNVATVTVNVGAPLSGADLVIGVSDIRMNPAKPTAGQSVTIDVTVNNFGVTPASHAVVELFNGDPAAGGVLLQSATFDIDPGQTRTLTRSWVVPSGKHTLFAVADRANTIVEINENNNMARASLMTDMVDIVVSSSDMTLMPAYPVVGDTVALTVSASNAGISPTGAFQLSVYDGDPANGGTHLQTHTVDTLSGGGNQSMVYHFTAEARTYRFYAVADRSNQVNEYSDDNNIAMRTLVVKGAGETYGPDLKVTKLDTAHVLTDPLTLHTTGQVGVTFKNTGDEKIMTPFTVCVYEDSNRDGQYTAGVDKSLGQTQTSQHIWPNGAFLVQVPLSGTVTFAGNLVSAMVDMTDSLVETNEDNNTYTSGGDCDVRPSSPIQPVVEWSWKQPTPGGINPLTYSTPAIISLIDTNGDGRVDEKDIPYLVFNMIPNNYDYYVNYWGELRAFKGDGSSELFKVFNDNTHFNWQGYVAVGDIDKDGFPEIITNTRSVAGVGTTLIAYNHDGTFKWENSVQIQAWNVTNPLYQIQINESTKPIIADLDGDGNVEIIAGGGANVFNADGSVKSGVYDSQRNAGVNSTEIVCDLDLDGKQDILAGTSAYNSNGSLKWQMSPRLMYGYTAIGNLDNDPYPEIAVVDGTGYIQPYALRLYVYGHDGVLQLGPVNISQLEGIACQYEGQYPIIADFDGDGQNEIGVRGAGIYYIFDRQGNVKTQLHLHPHQAGTFKGLNNSPTVFDLNGDGRPEVLIKSDNFFQIFDGKEGNLLFEESFNEPFYSYYRQNVFVADLDGDNHSEILVLGYNSSTGECFRVYGSANNDWVNARRIWNQQSYHVTNINDDGSIPRHEEPSWLAQNTYRCQIPVGGGNNPYLTPNMTASYIRAVEEVNGLTLTARIGNGGSAKAQPGVAVNFYLGDMASGTLIGSASTSKPLEPGEYQDVRVIWTGATGTDVTITAVADPGNTVSECNEDDNSIDMEYTVPVHLPDFSIVSDDIVVPQGPISEGAVLQIAATLRNRGLVSSPDAGVALYNGNPASGGTVVEPSQTLISMGPSGEETLVFTIDTLGLPERSVFYVVVDGANLIEEENEDNNKAPFNVNLVKPNLPNLTVAPVDIVREPAEVQPGEPVLITATIHNRGSAVGGIPVNLYLNHAGQPRVLIAETTVYQNIAHGESATVSAQFPTTDLSGAYTVSVEIDPLNTIPESDETDNKAVAGISVLSSNLTATLTTDKGLYSSNENVAISLNLQNGRSSERHLTVNISVLKPDNTVVGSAVKDGALSLDPNGSYTLTAQWNTLGTFHGDMRVLAEIKENGFTAKRVFKDFIIGADQSIDLRITSSKTGYKDHENVALNAVLTSKTSNYIFNDLRALVEVIGPGQTTLLSKERSIATLMPKATQSWSTTWSTANYAPGTYTAMLKLYSGQSLIDSGQTTFTILSSAVSGNGLTGTLAFDPSTMVQGQSSVISYTVNNKGNAPLNNLIIRTLVVNPTTDAIVRQFETTADMGLNASVTGSALFSSANVAPGSYMVVLQADHADFTAPYPIASSYLKVVVPADPCARVTDRLLGQYRFNEGSGKNIHDSSTTGNPLDFLIDDEYRVSWIKNGGLSTYVDTPIVTQGSADKILSAWKSSGNAMSVELWIRPYSNDLNIEPGTYVPIVNVFNNDTEILTVAQFKPVSSSPVPDVFMVILNDGQGAPEYITAPSDALTSGLVHLVLTHDTNGNARLFINETQVASAVTGFDLSSLTISNPYISLNEEIPAWEGDYFLLALYNKALSSSEIGQNRNACPPAPALHIPHRPVADAGGPYLAYAGEAINVNGGLSFDLDDGQSENGQSPYDSIISYLWEVQMIEPFGFDDASGVLAVLPSYSSPGIYSIALQIKDNSKLAYPVSTTDNLTGRSFSQVVVHKLTSVYFAGQIYQGIGKLSWNNKCASKYEILRSEKGPNENYKLLATTNSKTYYYKDNTVQLHKSYWYRLRMVLNGETVITKAVKISF